MKFTKINTLTGLINKIKSSLNKETIGLGNVDNTSDINKPVSKATQNALNSKTFIRTASGNMVMSVDDTDGAYIGTNGSDILIDNINTDGTINDILLNNEGISIASDADVKISGENVTVKGKSILTTDNLTDTYSSTSGQAMSGKAVASAISGVTKSTVGLGNVDNTSDADKPVSTATQELLDNKADKTDIIPNNDSFSEGNTNEIGWYRIGQINNNNYGAGCNSCEIIISRYWATLPNEYHHIYFTGIYKSRQFNSVSNKSLEQMFDKIRYSESSDGSIGYLDIHSQYKSVNGVTVKLLNKKNSGQEWQSVWEYLGTGELTEQVIYNIPANSQLSQKADLDLKADKTDLDNTMYYYDANEIKWIRVAEFIGENNNQTTGSICNSCEIVIGRDYYNTNNEYHHLYFSGINNNRKFSSINNLSNAQIIDKIRYVVVDENGTKKSYIDVHYNGTVYNRFFVKLLNIKNYLFEWKNVSIPLDNNDITGQVVYNIPANSELAQKETVDALEERVAALEAKINA